MTKIPNLANQEVLCQACITMPLNVLFLPTFYLITTQPRDCFPYLVSTTLMKLFTGLIEGKCYFPSFELSLYCISFNSCMCLSKTQLFRSNPIWLNDFTLRKYK